MVNIRHSVARRAWQSKDVASGTTGFGPVFCGEPIGASVPDCGTGFGESVRKTKNLMNELSGTEADVTAVREVENEETASIFKKCTLCGMVWRNREEFLQDPTLILNGYQGSLQGLLSGKQKRGLLLFTHLTEECGTTLACDPSAFKDDS